MFKYSIGSCLLILSNFVIAGEMGPSQSSSGEGFFLGIGGNYNSTYLQKQTIYGKGMTNGYAGGVLATSGSAAGTSNPFYQQESVLTPTAQAGYLRNFKNNANFWGAKFAYNYLNTHLSDANMTIPQAGANYNYLSQVTTPFTGNYLVESAQTSVNHELLLLALIGHSFEHCKAYLGIGPALFNVQSNINHFVGHADYLYPGQVISPPQYLSDSSWEWGGSAQLGITYELSSSWFLDFNYTYAATARYTIKYVSPFTNFVADQSLIGTSFINPSQQVTVQSVGVSINKHF